MVALSLAVCHSLRLSPPNLRAMRGYGTPRDSTTNIYHYYLTSPSIILLTSNILPSCLPFTTKKFHGMAALLLTYLLLLDHSLLSLAQGQPEPLQVPASPTLYGPDGPWQAVSVKLGIPAQSLDLYPGGVFQSTVFTNQSCQHITSKPCGSGGLFFPESSNSIDNSIGYTVSPPSSWTNGALLLNYPPAGSNNSEKSIRDQLQIADEIVVNFSVATYPEISMVYPDGDYPLQVGALSLGPTLNQSFGDETINASLIPGYLYTKDIIPSSSFGLHVGTTTTSPLVELSLWLGGYDASRIVGPVSAQSIQDDAGSEFVIDLLDIGIGVDSGGSPFPFSSQQGLLSEGNSTISREQQLPILMNPAAPYLNLPNSTCAAIARILPVTYNAGKALYFWDVNDPRFAKIVTSPTYLSFIFGVSTGNMTIKVPFSLLNLTLEEPLVSTPTPYFPCQPPQAPDAFTTYYSLGRAFLQAAFIGVTWSNQGVGTWYLAQAPGPDIDTNPQQRPFTIDAPPVGLSANWSDTWTNHWTALPLSPSPTTSAILTPSKQGLSGGAIAGIAIGAVIAVLIVFGICVFVLRRRRAGKPAAGYNMHMNIYGKQGGNPVEPSAAGYEPMYKDQSGHHSGEPVELSITREHVGELQ